MTTKPLLKLSGAVLVAGIVFGVGVRISQWLVPAPAVRVTFCDSSAAEDACLVVEDDVEIPAGLLERAPSNSPYPSPQRI